MKKIYPDRVIDPIDPAFADTIHDMYTNLVMNYRRDYEAFYATCLMFRLHRRIVLPNDDSLLDVDPICPVPFLRTISLRLIDLERRENCPQLTAARMADIIVEYPVEFNYRKLAELPVDAFDHLVKYMVNSINIDPLPLIYDDDFAREALHHIL